MEFPFKRIIWAVDAFPEDRTVQDRTAELLRSIRLPKDVSITPVFVMQAKRYMAPPNASDQWFEPIRKAATHSLEVLSTESKLTNLNTPFIAPQFTRSDRSAVKSLLEAAEELKADLIVVGTHGRSGTPRFFLGSFAETLILHSKTPLLVIGPKEAPPHKDLFQHLLFPTDLSVESRKVFEQVIQLAKHQESNLTVFHSTPEGLGPVIKGGGYLLGGVPPTSWSDFPPQESEVEDAELRSWVEQAKTQGVQTDGHFASRKASVAASILDAIEETGASLVVQQAQSGPLKSALVGSITRQVVRTSTIPVLILPGRSLHVQ